MPITYPVPSSTFPSAAWWANLAASTQAAIESAAAAALASAAAGTATAVDAAVKPVRDTVTTGRLSVADLEATIAAMIEDRVGTVRVFASQAEAAEWQARHPDSLALWVDTGDGPPPATAFLTDFTEGPLDEIPDEWSARWVIPSSNGWKIETATGATGGRALVHRGADNARRSLTWDVVDDLDTTDVEVVTKWRSSNLSPARVLARGSGVAAAENGYLGGVRNATNQSVMKFVNGTSTLPLGPQAAGSYAADVWYITRLRVEGSQVSARTWPASEAEPAAWAVTTTDTDIPADGWVGLHAFGAGVMTFDWVGVAVGGETAPKGP